MLTRGDLVRIKQGTFLYPINLEPWFVKKLDEPEYGVVIQKEKANETRVLICENAWIVENKCLQLIGEDDVYKSTKSIER
jgi:hypothetical protein